VFWPAAVDNRCARASSNARHLLEDRYDIRTIPELLGHKGMATMIYTYVLNRGGKGVRSPADAL
jgi:site-specific recombinase XerC